MLERLEFVRLHGNSVELPKFESLEPFLKERSLSGVPLHFASPLVQDILERVERTALHHDKHPDIEFALFVRVFPYPNDTFSVWVFLCSSFPE